MSSLPRRAAIYARVSSPRQQKQSTIQNQVTQLRCRWDERATETPPVPACGSAAEGAPR